VTGPASSNPRYSEKTLEATQKLLSVNGSSL